MDVCSFVDGHVIFLNNVRNCHFCVKIKRKNKYGNHILINNPFFLLLGEPDLDYPILAAAPETCKC